MRKLHLHMGVKDLNKSVSFYETLFKSKPTKLKKDYAQWILEDPKINFAISTMSKVPGAVYLQDIPISLQAESTPFFATDQKGSFACP